MHFRRLLLSLALALLCGMVAFSSAFAFPPLPSSFYGQVRVNDQFVPDGSLVRALIGGTAYAETHTQTYQGNAVYNLTVPGDDASTPEVEGGKEGDVVQFEVAGVIVDQSGAWHGGTNQNLDLSAGSGAPQPTAQPTSQPTAQPTSRPTRTPNPARTPVATRVPSTAANPTLPAPTATAVQPAANPTISSMNPVPTAVATAVSTAPGLPVQTAAQTALAPEPTQASAAGGTPTASSVGESGDGTAPPGPTSPGLLVAALVGAVVIGGGAWLLLRRNK